MEIFGVGPWELMLVIVIAFVVLGPEKIPSIMRTIGRTVRQLRQMSQQLTSEFGDEIKEVTGDITAVQREFQGVQRDLGQMAKSVVARLPNEPESAPTSALAATSPPPVPDPSAPADPGTPGSGAQPDA